MPEPQPHEIIWALSTAAVAGRCIQVVAALGVADHVGDEPVAIDALAESLGTHPDALDRVLRLLAAHGVFERGDGTYRHTPASRLLRTEEPRSMRAFPQMMGLPGLWGPLTELEHSVRTGAPSIEKIDPGGFWAYLQNRTDDARIFGQAMTAKANADIAAVLTVYDFSRFTTIADIGGGRGHLLHAVLDAARQSHGILFDLPRVIETLDFDHERLTPQPGDFFKDSLPAADAYVLMEVIHDWPDAECVAILRAIRRAAPAHAKVLIIECVINEERPDPRAHTLDIIMLTVPGGRERTPRQLGGLLEQAGFRLDKVIPTPGAISIVEAGV
jgi:hypothetical protein